MNFDLRRLSTVWMYGATQVDLYGIQVCFVNREESRRDASLTVVTKILCNIISLNDGSSNPFCEMQQNGSTAEGTPANVRDGMCKLKNSTCLSPG